METSVTKTIEANGPGAMVFSLGVEVYPGIKSMDKVLVFIVKAR